MTDLPRGAIELAPSTRSLLGRLAKRLARPLSGAIEPELVETAEEELGSPIPLEILALLAAEGRAPGDIFALTDAIRAFHTAQEHDLGDLGFDHLAFGMISDVDIDTGMWSAEPVVAIVKRHHDRAAPPRYARWELRNPTPNGTPYSLGEYLAERHRMVLGAVAGSELFDFSIAKAAVNAPVVTHAKFGRGRVVARGEGKVTVAFDDGTTRTLAERFVTPA